MTRIFLCIFILLTSLPSLAADDLSNELALAESWLAAQRAYDHVPALSAAIVCDQDGHEVSFRRNADGKVAHIVYHGMVWPKM